MAGVASLGKIGDHVVGIGGALEILQVAGHAGVGGQVVIIVDMAVSALAGRDGVQASENESGGVVVERSIEPGSSVMALLAGLREVRADVIGIGRSLKILQMARHASGSGEVVIVIDVAVGALARRNGMRVGEGKSHGGVIKFRIQPIVGAVA